MSNDISLTLEDSAPSSHSRLFGIIIMQGILTVGQDQFKKKLKLLSRFGFVLNRYNYKFNAKNSANYPVDSTSAQPAR